MLVKREIADPQRLGVTGGSYGRCMTAWLITQDSRFAAAVVVAPSTNKVSQHLICNIPQNERMSESTHNTFLPSIRFQLSRRISRA